MSLSFHTLIIIWEKEGKGFMLLDWIFNYITK